jgi:hypothetical protein
VWLNEIKLAHTRIAHYLNGNWEYTAVTSEDGTPGFIIDRWYHVGVVHTAGQVWIFINNQAFSFRSQAVAAPVQIDINPAQGQVDNEYSAMFIDEVLVDPSVAESSELFYQNTAKKRPWGKLDDQYPWFIINVQDPRYFKTNIFQSPDFTAAVRNIINGGS